LDTGLHNQEACLPNQKLSGLVCPYAIRDSDFPVLAQVIHSGRGEVFRTLDPLQPLQTAVQLNSNVWARARKPADSYSAYTAIVGAERFDLTALPDRRTFASRRIVEDFLQLSTIRAVCSER